MIIPPVERFAPGVWSVPVPMPDNPLRFITAYLLESDDGFVMVDSGWSTPEGYRAVLDGLERAGGGIGDVRGVLVTHLHADHFGLAGRIREESGAWVAMHPADSELLVDRYDRVDELLERTADWLVRTGADEGQVQELYQASMAIRDYVVTGHPDRSLEDGDDAGVPGWRLRAVHTPGHTPGHLCFVAEDAGLVFTGDHVLPRITPNVGVHPQSSADPLGDFLSSLERMRGHGDALAAPGHEYRFRGLDQRIDELIAHHDARLLEARDIVAGGASTVWEVAERMSWSRGWDGLAGFMRRLALSEVHAHLVVLERRGEVVSEGRTPIRWSVAA